MAILITGDTFGYLGSAQYLEYEAFNRAMTLFLLLQVCSLFSFSLHYRSRMGRIARIALYTAIVGWIGMAAGTAAEFWLYSDLSYSVQNMRQVAFSLFSLSGLLVGIALLVLGITLFRSRALPRYFSIALIGYLFLDTTLFFTGSSIFLASAVYSIIIALAAMPVFSRAVASQEQNSAIEE